MTIIIKNSYTLLYKEFKFKCCIGKKGLARDKKEGDKKTPVGTFKLGNLFYRPDRCKKPYTKLNCIKIRKNMKWSNDIRNRKLYNRLFTKKVNVSHEKLFRRDFKYDYFIPISYNLKKPIINKGSAIFIHLTKNYKSTAGCIALSKKDFLILIKLINKKTKIKIQNN